MGWANGDCIDLGAQISRISSGFCELLTLEVYPLGQLLELEGTGGSAIPYLGYVDHRYKRYNEDVLLLVILTMTYSEKVPVVVWTQGHRLGNGNDDQGGTHEGNCDLEQAHFGAVMSGLLQLPSADSEEDGGVGKEVTPSPSL